ncbi:MAG: NAD-binding protein [Candidatus Micrarchaeota archaeon]|nr:NAD-binding protein [Candidatus Micrarchaeota archaeon]
MVKLRAVQIISVILIFVIFIVSTALVASANYTILAASLFTMMNIIGATFPPSASLVDAKNPLILFSLTLAGIANVIFTITFATIFYQLLVGIDVRYVLLKQRLRTVSSHVVLTPINSMSLELARKLKENRTQPLLIDENKYEVRRAHRAGFLAIHGNPAEQDTLREARVDHALALCTLYDDDIKNTLVTIEARRGGRQIRVLTRIKHVEDIPKMERSGARRVILPEAAVGIELGDFLLANS